MMKKIWEIQYDSLPSAVKYCKKCGRKTEFICSRRFRINAQQKYLDIWLIYKCPDCSTTWNAEIYPRISPQSLDAKQLEGFHKNSAVLAERYAMDIGFLRKQGVEYKLPEYSVIGDDFSINESAELEIRSQYSLPVKVATIVRKKLQLSQKEYLQLIADGKIKSIPHQDLKKCKLNQKILLIFNG